MASRRYELGVGALVVGAGALFAWMATQVGGLQMGETVQVDAVFEDVSGLTAGAAVTVAGVEIGRVTGLAVDFNAARVSLSLDAEAQIREDARFEIRAKSLLGEKFIAVEPVSEDAPLLTDGAQITNTRSPLEITQLVTELGPVIEALDPERLSASLAALTDALEEDPERIKRMLEDAEATLTHLRTVSEDAPATLVEARAAVREVRGAVARARPVLDRAERALADIEQASGALPALTDRLPGMAEDAEITLSEARALAEALGGETERIERILANVEEIDKWELRRLLREEGILVRLRESEVVEED